jgi:hypothetical protein
MELSKINDVLSRAVRDLAEERTYTFQGKKGVWRTVKGSKIFFPSDGSKPTGMPGEMTGKGVEKGSAADKAGAAMPTKKKKVPKKKKSSPAEIKKGKQQLRSKAGRKQAFGGKKKELDDAATGSGGSAVDEIEKDGSPDEKEALDKLDKGQKLSKGQGQKLLKKGVKAAMLFGVGAMLLSALPAILGYAAAAMIMGHAVKAAGRRMGRAFEERTSPRHRLADAIEGGLKDAIAQVTSGDVDPDELEHAIKYAEKKSRGKGSDASL